MYTIALLVVFFAAPLIAQLTGLTTPTAISQSAPTFSSATVEGSQLTITFFLSDLDPDSYAAAADFTVLLGETMQAVQSVAVNTDHLVLTLAVPIPDVECTTEAVTVSYSATSSTLAGSDGTAVAAFSEASVTNETDAPPAIVSLETDTTGRFIYVTFCESIADLSYQWSDFSAFSVVIDGDAVDVDDLLRWSDTPSRLDIKLPSEPAIREGHEVTVAYDQDQGDKNYPLQDDNQENKLVNSWSSRMVTNNVDSPPTLTAVSSLYENVTMTFNEALDESSTPDPSAFEFGGIQSPPQVQQVEVSGNQVLLTLDGILDNRDSATYTLSYLVPNDRPLREADMSHDVENIFQFEFSSSTPTTKPALVKAEVDGATLTIEFNLPLKAVAAGSTFEVAGVAGLTVVSTSFSGSSLTLTLSEAVGAGDSITVTYARPDSPPRIEGRNNQDAESFNAYAVDNVTSAPAPAPAMSMATVAADGASMTLTFSVPLDQSDEGLPELTAFSLSGTEATIESLSIFDSTVALVLNPATDVGETVLLSYVAPSDATKPRLRSATHAVPVVQISGASVVNNADGKPRVVTATVDKAEIQVGFDRALDSLSTPAATAFAIGGLMTSVSSVGISGRILNLTIYPPVSHEDTIAVSYTTPSDSPLKRNGKAPLVDSFMGLAVTNGTEDPTPTFISASVDASGQTLTIVMSHPLVATSIGVPAATTFTLSGTTLAMIESVTVDGSEIRLTLDPSGDLGERVSINYSPPMDSALPALQSVDDKSKTAAWSNESVTNNADGVPRLITATGNAASVELNFDRDLNDVAVPANADFTITPSGKSVSDVNINGATVTLVLSDALDYDDEVTVSYLATGSVKLKRDGRLLDVEAFSAVEVENKTPKPLLQSIVGNEQEIVVMFSRLLDGNSVPDATSFSLGSEQPSVTNVTLSGMTVTLDLDSSLQEGADYALAYKAPALSPLVIAEGAQVSSFSESVNNITDVAPQAVSATGDGSNVTITFDQSLDLGSVAATDSLFFFVETDVEVSAVTFADDSLSLTLSRELVEDEVASISYTVPEQGGIADSGGNRTLSFSLKIDNLTDTAPVAVTGTVEDDTIIIILDQELVQDDRFGANAVCPYEREADDDEDKPSYPIEHFTLTGTGALISFVCVSHNGPGGDGRIEIRLAKKVKEGEGISINYFPMSGSIRIEDNDAGENRAQINNYSLQNLTDEPPIVESATVNAETVTVTFDQALDPDSVPPASAFSLTGEHSPSVILASIQGAVLTLTLAESVVEDVTYKLSYTPTEGGKLLDKTGNAAEAFELLEMFENTTDYAPLPITVKTDDVGSKLTIEFDQRLDPSNTIDHSWFSLEPAHPVISAELESDIADQQRLIVKLEPGVRIREGASVSLIYSPPPSGGLQDDDAPNAVLGFTIAVHNAVDVAPVVERATVNGRVLEIEFDQALDENQFHPQTVGSWRMKALTAFAI